MLHIFNVYDDAVNTTAEALTNEWNQPVSFVDLCLHMYEKKNLWDLHVCVSPLSS